MKEMQSTLKEREYGILNILLKGVENSNSETQLKQTIAELIAFRNNP